MDQTSDGRCRTGAKAKTEIGKNGWEMDGKEN